MKRYQSVPVSFSRDDTGSIIKNVQVIGDMRYCTGIAVIKVEQTPVPYSPNSPMTSSPRISPDDVDIMTISITKNTGLVIAPVPVHFFTQALTMPLWPIFLPVNFDVFNQNINLNFEIAKPLLADVTYDVVLELDNTANKIEPYQFQNWLIQITSASLQTQTYNLNSEYQKIKGIWIRKLKITEGASLIYYKIKHNPCYIEIRSFSNELILDNSNTRLFEKPASTNLLQTIFPFKFNIKQKSIYFEFEQPTTADPYQYLDIVLLLGKDEQKKTELKTS